MNTRWELENGKYIQYSPFCKGIAFSIRSSIASYREAGLEPTRLLLSPNAYAMITAHLNFEDNNEELVFPDTYQDIQISVTNKLSEEVSYDIVLSPSEEFLGF